MGVAYALYAHKYGPQEEQPRVHLEERHDNAGAHETLRDIEMVNVANCKGTNLPMKL